MESTRRDAIKKCFIISVGIAVIPACLQEKSKASIAVKNIDITGEQEKLIAELSETIIPATDTPGAKDTYTHLFVLKMLDDCYSKEDQQKFMQGMKEFDKLSNQKFNKSFVNATPQQREELVKDVIKNKATLKDATAFFQIMKKLTIQGYVTSKYYLTNVQIYKLVPGKFSGCIPVNSIKQTPASI